MLTVLSLFLPYLLGLGLFVTIFCFDAFNAIYLQRSKRTAFIGLILVSGTLLNYLLTLLLENIYLALSVGTVLSFVGIFYAFVWKRKHMLTIFNFGWLTWALVLYLTALFAITIVFLPLAAWDARSIWFFHGKIIYYGHSLNQSDFIQAGIGFSHTDYPKLIPVVAAQFASVAGFWNEYLPKASLLTLLVPALMGMFSFFNGIKISFLYLVSMLLFSIHSEFLWNGYMDGYLAIFAGISLLFLGRWFEERDDLDFWCGTVYLGIVLNLKNEGTLYVLIIVIVLFALIYFKDKSMERFRSLLQHRHLLVLLIPPIACFALWSLKKIIWGLENDLQLGVESLNRIFIHIQEGGLSQIVKGLIVNFPVLGTALVLALALLIAKMFREKIPFSAWISVSTSVAYLLSLFLVYLSTPHSLSWHLWASADRTMLPVLFGFFIATFFVLERLDSCQRMGNL